MSQRKIIFFVIVALVLLGAGILFAVLTSEKKETSKWPKELRVWVVWDDVAGYEDIVKEFKSKYDRYKNTEVRITKFASYPDYEKTLLNVIADGNSPDVFMVPSDGAGVLESKIEPIPDQYFSTEEFTRNFNRVFDSLVTERMGKNEEGKEVVFSELKGIPMGYETMGAFYNLDIVTNAVARTWKELGEESSSRSASADSEGESGRGSKTPVLAGIGLGTKYVQNASDLAALFFVQSGIENFENLGDNVSSKAFGEYLAFGVPSSSSRSDVTPNGNDLSRAKSGMDRLWLTVTDLFARGEIGVVFGFPSYLREIQYSVKRASQENVLNKRNLKTTNVPVLETSKAANLARFNYFALSKYAQDQQGGLEFVLHLASPASQASYMENFPYVLPAHNDLVDTRKDQVVSKDFPRVRYDSFLPPSGTKVLAFDKGFSVEYDRFFRSGIEVEKDARSLLSDLSAVLKCHRRHLLEGQNFEEACPTY